MHNFILTCSRKFTPSIQSTRAFTGIDKISRKSPLHSAVFIFSKYVVEIHLQCTEIQLKQHFLLGSLETIFHLVSVKAMHKGNWGLLGEEKNVGFLHVNRLHTAAF